MALSQCQNELSSLSSCTLQFPTGGGGGGNVKYRYRIKIDVVWQSESVHCDRQSLSLCQNGGWNWQPCLHGWWLHLILQWIPTLPVNGARSKRLVSQAGVTLCTLTTRQHSPDRCTSSKQFFDPAYASLSFYCFRFVLFLLSIPNPQPHHINWNAAYTSNPAIIRPSEEGVTGYRRGGGEKDSKSYP